MKHLIIGASAAGIAAARKIRALRPDDEITIVAKDGAPHSRCMLHHFIGGHKSAEEINFAGADFFEKLPIGIILVLEQVFDESYHVSPPVTGFSVSWNGRGTAEHALLLTQECAKSSGYYIP